MNEPDKDERKKASEQQGSDAGEDEGSAHQEGKDDHLKEDQKPISH